MTAWKLIEKDENGLKITEHVFRTKRDMMDFADTFCPIVERLNRYEFLAVF